MSKTPKKQQKTVLMPLNGKQEKFSNEYLVDLNATQAAIRSKYSKKTAAIIGHENLQKPNIQQRISELQAELRQKAKDDPDIATVEEVLQGFTKETRFKLGSLCHKDGTFKLPHELDPIAQNIVSGVDVEQRIATLKNGEIEAKVIKLKYKIPEKFKSRESIGKHFGFYELDNKQKRISLEELLGYLPEPYARSIRGKLAGLLPR